MKTKILAIILAFSFVAYARSGEIENILATIKHPTPAAQSLQPTPSPSGITETQPVPPKRRPKTPAAINPVSSDDIRETLKSMPVTGRPEDAERRTALQQQLQKRPDFVPRAVATPDALQVVDATWKRDGLGLVATWKVTFWNHSDRPIGNITYRTAYVAETGARVDGSRDTIQKVIAPNEKRMIEINDGFLNHEAVQASFGVISWEFISLK